MQVVIDIPNDIIVHISDGSFKSRPDDKDILVSAVMDGIPLPKDHGRLIDADKTLVAMNTFDKFGYLPHDLIPLRSENDIKLIPYVHYDDMVKCIITMPTIIEADKEPENEI